MGFFSAKKNEVRYGAIIDIGSGSVLVAIVYSDPNKTHPDIVWSKREYTPLKNITSISQSAKNVMSSLLNALMLLDSEGKRILHETTGVTKIKTVQVTISAPWSYTVTKSISYKHEEPFSLTKDLVAELLRTAHKKVDEELQENEKINNLGLSVISRSVISIIANGYQILLPTNQEARTLTIVESNSVAQDYLLQAIEEVHAKVLPNSKLYQYSFILVYYFIIKNLYPDTQEYCLIDITYEATELGIVRDGILNYSTHTAYGSFSLAREMSAILKVPIEEAFGYLHEENFEVMLNDYSEGQKADITKLLVEYQNKITELFHETGDSLAIPKKIFLHGNLKTEPFFKSQIAKAAKEATDSSHAIYAVSSELLAKHYQSDTQKTFLQATSDTALLLSAQFFHTKEFHARFEQL